MKIIFIGFGKMAREVHLPKVRTFANEIYFYDPFVSSSDAKKIDINDLDKYDLGIVSSLNSLHFEGYSLLKNRCKNIFIEKPVFIKKENLDKVLLSKDKIYTGHILRGKKSTLWLNSFLQKNKTQINEIYLSVGNPYGWNRKIDYNNDEWFENYGVLHDVGVHILDVLLWSINVNNNSYSVSDINIKTSNNGGDFSGSFKLNEIPVKMRFSNTTFLPFEIKINLKDDMIIWSPNSITLVKDGFSYTPHSKFKGRSDNGIFEDILESKNNSIYHLDKSYNQVVEILEKSSYDHKHSN
jgi:hypothetical protein